MISLSPLYLRFFCSRPQSRLSLLFRESIVVTGAANHGADGGSPCCLSYRPRLEPSVDPCRHRPQ